MHSENHGQRLARLIKAQYVSSLQSVVLMLIEERQRTRMELSRIWAAEYQAYVKAEQFCEKSFFYFPAWFLRKIFLSGSIKKRFFELDKKVADIWEEAIFQEQQCLLALKMIEQRNDKQFQAIMHNIRDNLGKVSFELLLFAVPVDVRQRSIDEAIANSAMLKGN